MKTAIFFITVLVCAIYKVAPASAGTPKYKMDASGRQVVSLIDLSDKEDCFPSTLTGKIAKREFDKSGLNIESIVLENADGTRTFVNAGENRGSDAVTVGNVKRGLETMLKEGRRVALGVWACGAAGRVLRIHSVRAVK